MVRGVAESRLSGETLTARPAIAKPVIIPAVTIAKPVRIMPAVTIAKPVRIIPAVTIAKPVIKPAVTIAKPVIKPAVTIAKPVIIEPVKTELINEEKKDMTKFSKTIFGKVLGVAAKTVLPIAAAVTGVGAITGMAKGVGAIAGVKNTFGGAVKGIDAVATKAADLVTGMTKDQRQVLNAQKDEARDAKDKLDFAKKLMGAGMDEKTAYSKAGIAATKTGGGLTENGGTGKVLLWGGVVLAAIALLAKYGKKLIK